MSKYTRVYHPTLNSWQDVEASAVDGWKDAGWRTTKPEHVDDANTLPPGPRFIASVVRAPDPAPAEVVAPKAEPKK